MREQTEVRATVDAKISEQASAIFAAAGYTISDAMRMLLLRTVEENGLPFDPLIPNETTQQAMLAARRGEVVTVGSLADLMADLHADD